MASEYQQEESSSESEEEDSGNKNKQSELAPSNTLSVAAADSSATSAPPYNRRFQVTKRPNSLTCWNVVRCNHNIQYFWA